jgi:hypothetical protein
MVNENETARREDRPVEPPMIEGEAEEIKEIEEPIQEEPAMSEPETSAHREPPAAAADAPEGKAAWGISPVLVVAVLALVLAGSSLLAAAGLISLGTPAQRPNVEPRLAAVEAASRELGGRIEELTSAINRLNEESQGSAARGPAQGSGVEEQIRKLETQFAGLSGALEAVGTSLKTIESRLIAQQQEAKNTAQLMSELSSRVKAPAPLSQAAPENNAQAQSREKVSALLRLRRAVQDGRPFAQELQALQGVVAEAADPRIVQLSVQGVLSREELTSRLRAMADELRAASLRQTPAARPANVWEAFKSKAASLVSVRRIDEAQILDLIARAAQLIEQGDLEGAVQLLNSTQNQRPASVEAWLKHAQARLEAEKGSETLTAKVLEQLGSGS